MTGPEHYREAERLMRWWSETTPPERKLLRRNTRQHGATPLAECVAAAQVHATLALAAATAVMDLSAWRDVIYGPVTE